MHIVVDTREQCPLDFTAYPDVHAQAGTLYVGDYSLRGLEHFVAVERKSLSDLVGSLSSGRERFEHEMQRGRGLRLLVVIEASYSDICQHAYRSRMSDVAVDNTMSAWAQRYGVHFFCADNPALAARKTVSWLSQYLRQARERLRAIERYHAEAVA